MMRTGFPTRFTGTLILLAAGFVFGQTAPSLTSKATSPPFPPLLPSPVEIFRVLLATNKAGREAVLASKSPYYRQVVETKMREYEAMPSGERESRLQALQLRWYVLPMMKMAPIDRALRLKAIPEPDRSLIEQRLRLWDILPPQMKKDLLENESAVRQGGGTNRPAPGTLNAAPGSELQAQLDRWNQLPPARQNQVMVNYQKFFELSQTDKDRTLAQLTDTERGQMEKTLSSFGTLPREDREQAMQGFKKFAQLSPAERVAFLKTAERWRTMSDQDRETWRKIVAQLQRAPSKLPPMPQDSTRPSPAAPLLGGTN